MVSLVRGLIAGGASEATLLTAWLSLLAFTVIGAMLGWLAERQRRNYRVALVCTLLCAAANIYFLPRVAPAEWIIYPSGPNGTVHPRLEMSTIFRRSFTLERAPAHALLSIAGLRQYTLAINGKPAAAPIRRGRA